MSAVTPDVLPATEVNVGGVLPVTLTVSGVETLAAANR